MLKFKELRKKKNLTQKEFAELISISLRALSNYENGNLDISFKKLQEIADLLNVPIYEIIEVENTLQEDFTNNTIKEPSDVYQKNNKLKDETIKLLEENCQLLKEQLQFYKQQLEDCQREKNIKQNAK